MQAFCSPNPIPASTGGCISRSTQRLARWWHGHPAPGRAPGNMGKMPIPLAPPSIGRCTQYRLACLDGLRGESLPWPAGATRTGAIRRSARCDSPAWAARLECQSPVRHTRAGCRPEARPLSGRGRPRGCRCVRYVTGAPIWCAASTACAQKWNAQPARVCSLMMRRHFASSRPSQSLPLAMRVLLA